ncbi:histidine phosphatase family protein [Streptomyces griseoruber]|uniref:histidine phosphatase family protein n=1 Tax=Streptomyces griseoruber TaxID=1943 RepID=UPI0037949031
MTSRVTFISPATNPSLRQARFDDSRTPLDDAGRAQARAAAGTLRPADRVVSSPGVRCQETAAALGLADAEPVAELAGPRWADGRAARSTRSARPSRMQWRSGWQTRPQPPTTGSRCRTTSRPAYPQSLSMALSRLARRVEAGGVERAARPGTATRPGAVRPAGTG